VSLDDGRPDFHALRSRHARQDARLIVYDLLGVHFTSAASAWRAYCALEPQLRYAGGIIPFHVHRLSPSLGSSCVN
jgi:hypothetical protein